MGAARGVPGELVTRAAPDAGAQLPGRFLRRNTQAREAREAGAAAHGSEAGSLPPSVPPFSPVCDASAPSPRSDWGVSLPRSVRRRLGDPGGLRAGLEGKRLSVLRPTAAGRRAQTCGKAVACAHCESPRAAPLSRLSDAVRFCVEGTPNSCAARTGRYSERAWKLSTSKFLFCGAIAGYYF